MGQPVQPEGERSGRVGDGQPTRGFLFADLRGYTSFVERNGAAAGAELLRRYRAAVRDTIGTYRGAEIRTEGDSFYVVFPSISSAVQCGIAISRGVATELASAGPSPVGVGVGVHAGETVETEEGYVGSAVNVAARLCALARPGEVLVSDTVRALTRNVLPLSFASRGRRHLKGVAEPVGVYAVGDSGSAVGTRLSRRGREAQVLGLVGAFVVAGLVVVALALGRGAPGAGSAVATGSASQAASDAASGAATASTAASASASPSFSAREQVLLDHVPPLIRPSCRPGPGVYGRAEVVCAVEPVRGAVRYTHFDSPDAMDAHYDEEFKPLTNDFPGPPECRDVRYERPYYGVPGTQTGRVNCLVYPHGPNLVWTDDAVAILAFEYPQDADVPDVGTVYRWWEEGTAGPQP